MSEQSKRIYVCVNGPHCSKLCGQKRPALVAQSLKDSAAAQGSYGNFEIASVGCLGMCGLGPNIRIHSGSRRNFAYCGVSPTDAGEIIAAHTLGDDPVERIRFQPGRAGQEGI